MSKSAIITGASSGMGRRFAETAREWGGIDEIWAIARRKERLLALRELSRIPVRALPYDLVEMGSIDALAKLLEEESLTSGYSSTPRALERSAAVWISGWKTRTG